MPIGDTVLVKQDPCKDRVGSLGILYAPQGEEEWPPTGTVIKVGPGAWERRGGELVRVPPDVQVGDRVLFQRQPDSALVPDARDGDPHGWSGYVMLDADHIIGVIEEE